MVFTIQSHTPFLIGTIDISRANEGSQHQHKVFNMDDEQNFGKGSVPFEPISFEGIYTILSNKEANVNGLDERRAEKRYGTDASVIFQLFCSSVYHRAIELNHSNSGVLFEGNVGLKPGAIVYIRRASCPQDCPKGDACESCRTISLASIKWCNEKGAADLPLYSVGAKYFEYGIGY